MSAASRAPVPEAGVDDDVGLRLEDVADLLEQLLAEAAEIRTAVVHGGVVHGAQHAVRGTLVGPGICRKWRPAVGLDW